MAETRSEKPKKKVENSALYPAHFKKVELPPHLKPQKFNSTSSLYIDSTISKPKNTELIQCIATYWLNEIVEDSSKIVNEKWREEYEIFDETRFPLSPEKGLMIDGNRLEKHIKSIFRTGQLAHESLIMAVAYLDRIRQNSDFHLQIINWRRMSLSCLILASKVWEDQAVWNVDFLELFPLTTPHDLGQLEKKLLSLLSFDVSLKASDYAKIYFDLKAQSSVIVEHFQELKPLDRDGEEKLELRTKNYALKYDLEDKETRVYRSTGSVDDFKNSIKSPRTILS
jgi:hypothetical protein